MATTSNAPQTTPTLSCVDSRPSVPGCQIEIGVYCCINEQSGFDRFSCDVCAIWYNTCDFMVLLESMSNISFFYQESRNSAISRLNNFPFGAPYSRTKRYPDHILFTRLSGEMLNHLKTVRTALSYRSSVNLWMEKYPQLKLPDSILIDDIKKGEQSHVSFREAITALKRGINNCDHTMNRSTFEKEYKINWINGDPECVQEVRDVSFLRPRQCCTFNALRERLNRIWDYLISTNDPYNYETVRVPENRFLRVSQINSNSPLPTSGFYIYARQRSGGTSRWVQRVTYDDNCTITFTNVAQFTEHPDYVLPLDPVPPGLLDSDIVDEEVED